jgi:hypothetical protein
MARRPGNACGDRRREAGTSICYLTDSCVANSKRRIGGCGPAISGCRTDGPLRDDGVFQTGGRREERKRARRRHRLTGLLRAGLPVGPRGFEPRTCGLRVRARLRLMAQGSRRGPVNERATTRNDGVARERKHTAHGSGRGNAAGQRSESRHLAKVGVAGSNPVVRSRK